MQKEKKILYLTSPYPYPSDFGGTQGYASNIEQLVKSKFGKQIYYIFSNLEKSIKQTFPYKECNYKIFQAEHEVSSLKKFLFSLHSMYGYLLKRIATNEIKKEISDYNADLIILDGYMCWLSLPKKQQYKLIYIIHNIESKFTLDQTLLISNIFVKLWYYVKILKIYYLEKKLFKYADKVVCVSTSDYNYFIQKYPDKVVSFPHRIKKREKKWKKNESCTLFFCGAMDFPPNYEAVEWIAKTLAPTLNSSIKIVISGKGTDTLPDDFKRKNIEYLGFISEEELIELYCNSSAFLCPIIYGSGIKMKVLEALGYAIPIIATKESLEGLNYIDVPILLDRNDLSKCKENIENLLLNNENLERYNKEIVNKVEASYNNSNNWNQLLENILSDGESGC